MAVEQYDIYWVDLEPTKGSEIKKVRPCVIVSPNEMNNNINMVIIAPLTRTSKKYPTRVQIEFDNKMGWVVLDQIRCIDKMRLLSKAGKLEDRNIIQVKSIIREMLVD